MTEFARPRLVLSRCLELEKVRYNGEKIAYDFVRELEPFVDLVPICPEVEIGLGVPRDPIRLVVGEDGVRLYQPSTRRDLTLAMQEFGDTFLSGLPPVDGFVLKNRSPSCGISDVKLHTPDGMPASSGKRAGMFGQAVIDRFGDLAVEDEGRLRNFRIREHFLTKLFALAALRQVEDSTAIRDLIDFHARYKFVLMAYSQKGLRELGRLVANGRDLALDDLMARYRVGFAAALRRPPKYTSVINVLDHAAGYFKRTLDGREKAMFRRQVDRYRSGRLPLAGVTAVLWAWVIREDEAYLQGQAFFQPYPDELMSVSDSGKGRKI
ncbi:MAG: DUF1722 domain-containing protein [Gemmatimonadota bacterium]|jgi:uncharacterized protein YbgA (DUF1722 family)/uncharacterized protein YbbK (DUF523 family)|nr:MAG: DUF1722 domain-containing protein [Gemmatimonadota bacterium]